MNVWGIIQAVRRTRRFAWRCTRRSCSGAGWWTWPSRSPRRWHCSEPRSNDCACARSPHSRSSTKSLLRRTSQPFGETVLRFCVLTIRRVFFNLIFFKVVNWLITHHSEFVSRAEQRFLRLPRCSVVYSAVVSVLSSVC